MRIIYIIMLLFVGYYSQQLYNITGQGNGDHFGETITISNNMLIVYAGSYSLGVEEQFMHTIYRLRLWCTRNPVNLPMIILDRSFPSPAMCWWCLHLVGYPTEGWCTCTICLLALA